MPIFAKSSVGNFETCDVGVHQAVCVFVEDIGTHEGSYNGKPIQRHQIVICWEIAQNMTQGEYAGNPFMISKFYTLSLSEKANLRKDLQSWRGKDFTDEELKGFDVEKLKGANCMLNIVEHEKRDKSKTVKIAAIMPVSKDTKKMKPVCTKAPEWIGKLRNESIEMKDCGAFGEPIPTTNTIDESDGLPF
jgi:hypothetical protein